MRRRRRIIKRKELTETSSRAIFISSLVASVTFFLLGGGLFLDEHFETYFVRSCHGGCAVDGKALILLFIGVAVLAGCEIVKLAASITVFRTVRHAFVQQVVLIVLAAIIYYLYKFHFSYPVTNYISTYSAIAYFIFSPVYSWLKFAKNAKK